MLQRGAPKLGKDGKPMKGKDGKVIYEPYRIKVLNTINFKKSMHYNPLMILRNGMKSSLPCSLSTPSLTAMNRTLCMGKTGSVSSTF